MKIQATVLKETARILVGCLILSAVMVLVYLIIGHFKISVPLGALVGSLLAVLNFLILGISLQKAVTKSEDNIKAIIRVSYSARMIVIFAILAVCLYSGWFDPIALLLPFIFPRIIIFGVNFFKRKNELGGEVDGQL